MTEELRSRFDEALRHALQRLPREPWGRHGSDCRDTLSDFALREGKRLRPLMFLSAYAGYSREDPAQVLPAAVALELFHDFALIHDDLVDHSQRRRGNLSLQHELAAGFRGQSRAEDLGRSLAMLSADVLFAAAVETFAEIETAPQLKETALRELMQTAQRTGEGVLREIVLREQPLGSLRQQDILNIHEQKTVGYTFGCPLRLAAILGRAPDGENERIAAYARCMGYAYQLYDDMNDLEAYLTKAATAEGMQLCETKLMLPLLYVWQQAKDNDRRWLRDLYAKNNADSHERERLFSLVQITNAMELTKEEARRLQKRANHLIGKLRMEAAVRDRLHCSLLHAVGCEPVEEPA